MIRLPPREDELINTFPFQEDAIKQILESVRGNLRGFLQTCYHAFQLAPKQPITREIVCKALKEAKIERPSLKKVADEIEAVLRDRSLNHTVVLSAGGRSSSVINDSAGRCLALLETSEALFIDD